MQDMLTALTQLLICSFISIMVFDLVTDLKRLILRSALNQSKCESKPEAIAPEPQYSNYPATLEWLEAMLSPNAEEVEVPNIFDLVRDRQLHNPTPEPETANQPQPDYKCLSIRQLKKLAGISKIKRYGAMSKRQLIEALAV